MQKFSKMFWMRRTGIEHAPENMSSLDSSRRLLHPLTSGKLFLHNHKWKETKLLFQWWDLPGFPVKTSEGIRRRDATQKPVLPVMMIISECSRDILNNQSKCSVPYLILEERIRNSAQWPGEILCLIAHDSFVGLPNPFLILFMFLASKTSW